MFWKKEDETARILREKPFRKIVSIAKISELKGRVAISGETFLVESIDGRKYKLRRCASRGKAKKIERNVLLMPHAFPKFYGRDRGYLLFDWVEGTMLGKEVPPEICYRIGKLAGEAHSLEDASGGSSLASFFNLRVKEIKKAGIYDKATLAKIVGFYKKITEKLKIDIILEFNDIHQSNMMLDSSGRVYFVDEEGFGHRVKGLGLAKPLLVPGWMKSEKQKAAFWLGYNEHHSSDYFDADYQRFISFLELVRSVSTKIRTKRDYEEHRKMLLGMVS